VVCHGTFCVGELHSKYEAGALCMKKRDAPPHKDDRRPGLTACFM